jgi:hypothetical protein
LSFIREGFKDLINHDPIFNSDDLKLGKELNDA